jgi:hypothetical protein
MVFIHFSGNSNAMRRRAKKKKALNVVVAQEMSPLVSDHYTYANIVLLLGDRSAITSDASAAEVELAVAGAFGGVCFLLLLLLFACLILFCCVEGRGNQFDRQSSDCFSRRRIGCARRHGNTPISPR